MPIKYVGRTTSFKGKTLWEIVGNLKNFGVGRMVIRNQFQRYPEPCYMRILKVAALPAQNMSAGEERKVTVLVERTFRGKTSSAPVQISSTSYKADYLLIPKDIESAYLSLKRVPEERLVPRTTEFPPLLKEVILRETAASRTKVSEEPRLLLRYNKTGIKNYRLAEEKETPTIDITVGLDTPVSPNLFSNITTKCPS